MIDLRLLERRDIAAVAAIARESHPAESTETVEGDLEEMFAKSATPPTYIVAERDGTIVGFVGFSSSRMDYLVAEIFWLTVSPACRRQGVGKLLVEEVLRQIRALPDIQLAMLAAYSPDYYLQFGFQTRTVYGKQKDYIMCLDL